MNPVQDVFDNQDLRKLILTNYVSDKYQNELKLGIQDLIMQIVITRWYHYCTCIQCENKRIYYMDIHGELL